MFIKKIHYLQGLIFLFVIISSVISAVTLFGQSLRLDESQSIWVSTKSITGILDYVAHDVHVPLYELLLHLWMQVFGRDIIFARLLSFLFFAASIPVLYRITTLVIDRTAAFVTAGLYILSPFIIWYAYEARMYSLFVFVVCVSHYYFLQILKSNGNKGETGYFFATLFGLYTHYFYIFFLASQAGFLVFYYVKRYGELKSFPLLWQRYKHEFFSYFHPLLLAGILFLPWLIYFKMLGLASYTQPFIQPPTSYVLFQTFVNFLFGLQPYNIQSILISLWPLAVVPLFILFSRRTKKHRFQYISYFLITLFLPIFLVFFLSFIRPIYIPRYLILIAPSFFMLLTWLLFSVSKGVSNLVITIAAFIMFCFLLYQNTSMSIPVKEDYKDVTEYLNQHTTPSDLIAVSPPFTIYPLMYYYNNRARIATIPEWNLYHVGPIQQYTKKGLDYQMKTYKVIYQNIFIVFSYDQGYEKSIKQFLDTYYQRLLIKKFSPGLELREYKLRY